LKQAGLFQVLAREQECSKHPQTEVVGQFEEAGVSSESIKLNFANPFAFLRCRPENHIFQKVCHADSIWHPYNPQISSPTFAFDGKECHVCWQIGNNDF